jgi:hypothetical protein
MSGKPMMRYLQAAFSLCVLMAAPSWAKITVVEKPDVAFRNAYYVSNRAPLTPSVLIKLPIGAIKPAGWLARQLELQADGFHGHLTDISQFLKKESNAWLSATGEGDRGWEEVPYWLKGFSNCAYVLGREDQIAETKIWIEGALNSQKADGWFGPDKDRGGAATRLKGRSDLWPNAIMLFCLQDHYDVSGDQRVIDLMTKYLRYLTTVPEEAFLLGYWPKMRGGDLLFSLHWLYNRTGGQWLLDLGAKVHRRTARWDQDVINWHNVNMSQAFAEGATYYVQSHNKDDLWAAERNYRKIRDIYGQVPGGMFAGDENCRPGYTGPRQAVETCGMVEMMLSQETLLHISGDLKWADRLEDVAFNSLPAALTADMKALRYLTSPNMVQSDRANKSPGLQNGGPMLHMNPHGHRCCQHNWGHGWPYYAQNLWMATPDNGLAAVLYNQCHVTAKVGSGTTVTIQERTHYPFDEQVWLTLSIEQPTAFPLYLRVPGWCEGPVLKINGRAVSVQARPNTFVKIARTWKDGDEVQWLLPMELSLRTWTRNHHSVSVDRGPLTYSLKINERYKRQGGTDQWPAWEIYPASPWNYGLVLNQANPAASFSVVKRAWPENNMPFTHAGCPIALQAWGKRIPQWQLDHQGLCMEIQDSPVISDQATDALTLIPMGSARLRVSSFPVIGSGPDAHAWKEAPRPLYRASASHEHDALMALCDEVLPKNSNDHSIARMTWWDHKGTKEWVKYDFNQAREVSSARVYWFDDTGVGFCRVPQSWRLLYRKGKAWKPVATREAYGAKPDQFNAVRFEPVTTSALRLEVELQPEYSGGILEWQIK